MRRFVLSLIVVLLCMVLEACGLTSLSVSPPTLKLTHVAPVHVNLSGPGSPAAGDILFTTNGNWSGSPTGFTYLWQDCNSSGGSCTTASGTPTNTNRYVIVAGDVGDTIRITVTATYPAGQTASQQSGPTLVVTSGSSPSCTTTVSSVSTLQSSVSSVADGSIVCVSAGTYGALSLTRTGSHSSMVTVEPVVGTNPNGTGKVTFSNIGIVANSSWLTVRDFYVTGGVTGSQQQTHVTVDHNDVQNPGGYGIAFPDVPATASSFVTVSGNTVYNTSTTGEGDALRFGWVNNLTVAGNDVYGITECVGSCHTDTMQVFTGGPILDSLNVNHNYIHDEVNGAQGFPFLKDENFTNVSITDNLSVRMSDSQGETTGLAFIDMCSANVQIADNTSIQSTGSVVQATGAAACTGGPTATVSHNVFDQFNTTGTHYTFTSDHNIFEQNPFSWTRGATDTVTASPAFQCGASCGTGGGPTVAVGPNDNFQLTTNPNGIGVDWNPDTTNFGPVNPVS